ncbi:MAG: hypothetical protein O2890_10015 [Cyanobacteria bacterium]|nr:hypothetical protein [Cyanobacteriota bacterium]
MLDPIITPVLAAPIAKIILDKLYEGAGSKFGEKLVEAASAQVQKLGQAVWNRCLRGRLGADKVLEAAAKGSDPELKQVRNYLLAEMKKPDFVDMVQPMAQEIHQVLVSMDDVNARNSMQIFGGEGFQNNDSQAPIMQGINNSPININYNYGNKSSD